MTSITQFSLPAAGQDNADLVGLLAAFQMQSAANRLQKEFLRLTGKNDEATGSVLAALEGVDPKSHFFRPEVGCLLKIFSLRDITLEMLMDIRAQLVITASLIGVLSDIDIGFSTASQLLLQGKLLAPGRYHLSVTASRITVSGDGLDTPLVIDKLAESGVFTGTLGESDAVIAVADKVISLGDLNPDFWAFWADSVNEPSHSPLAAGQLEAALSLLGQHIPHYQRWVTNVLHKVIPVRRPAQDTLASASIRYRFGAVEIACPASPFETLEMLIHECSHQYFNLALCLEPLVSDNAPAVYSPLKSKERPLFLLLTGYHAFGNVMLAYSSLKAAGFEASLADRDKKAIYYMRELSSGLEANRAYLTELGLSLYLPLREALLRIPEAVAMELVPDHG
ncbi:aKG-HExxH-type peptide beta-hydroxylase [Gallaecimonas pentaromativorans]|uniref:aKG-HExxH-type peptide beta-hydroxylase n=1 Tax=Gallaecimonas pentaromativorans TaxID=584787 RepID=UPI003A8F79FB